MTPQAETSRRAADRILALLAEADGVLEPGETPVLRVVTSSGLRRVRVAPPLVDRLIADGLLADHPAEAGLRRLAATAAGLARARRSAPGETDFRRQHGAVALRRLDEGAPLVLVDEDESPLARLARRRDKDGRAFLTPARFAAGERLREHLTPQRANGVASMLERIRGDARAALAARDRVRGALDAVGHDLADVLVDVCCFLKGLETIESDRRWPARSAKVVLDIALGRLADHYGLAEEARGPDRARGLRAWGSGDHRPSIGAAVDRSPPGSG